MGKKRDKNQPFYGWTCGDNIGFAVTIPSPEFEKKLIDLGATLFGTYTKKGKPDRVQYHADINILKALDIPTIDY